MTLAVGLPITPTEIPGSSDFVKHSRVLQLSLILNDTFCLVHRFMCGSVPSFLSLFQLHEDNPEFYTAQAFRQCGCISCSVKYRTVEAL